MGFGHFKRRCAVAYGGVIEPDTTNYPHYFAVRAFSHSNSEKPAVAIKAVREWLRVNVRKGYVTQPSTLGAGLRVLLSRDKDAVLFKLTFSDFVMKEVHLEKKLVA